MNSLGRRLEQLREALASPLTQLAMKERCEEQGHDYENCASIFLQIYQACKWCGDTKPFV